MIKLQRLGTVARAERWISAGKGKGLPDAYEGRGIEEKNWQGGHFRK